MQILEYLISPTFLNAALVTIGLTVISMALGILGGLVVAALDAAKFKPVSWLAKFYIWLFRGTPVLLQLVFVFNVLPLFGFTFEPFVCAVIALSLNEAAYMSEIIRGGLKGISPGQTLASRMLGLNKWQHMIYVIMPQLMRLILPPTGNQLIGMLKTSALASVIAVHDLMMVAQRTASGSFDYIGAFAAAAILYLALTTICTWILKIAENRVDPSRLSAKRRKRQGIYDTQVVEVVR